MLRKLGIIAASVVLGLAICEAILRHGAADLLPEPSAYRFDPDVGKRLVPGWQGNSFGTHVEINSHGLRNPEIGYARTPGTYRILALGDSWTFGYRMEAPDAWPRQLERILNRDVRQRGDPTRFEVVNTGAVGYSTEQEAALLRVEGYKYHPDMVVVAYYPVNDTHAKMAKYRLYQRLREIHPLLLEAWTLPRKLYLRQFWKGIRRVAWQRLGELRSALAGRLGYRDPGGVALAEDDWTGPYTAHDRHWLAARRALIEIGEQSRALGSRGLVMLLPDVLDLARYEDRYHPKVAPLVREATRAAGLEWLDLLEAFHPYRGREAEIRLSEQRHPNAYGYGLIARALARRIESDLRSTAAAP
ncbi:MAG: SGNH/GDSL hydrolase family protein [Myxococcota bacterium]